ncbi:hypothetical protein MNEG_14650 [Monoraphidium neglectum]|uniref:Uncharacterized protein n=1 Tax=Monoraphidium neglectum TaxID=145388 RepID=A0A0D2IZN3_9CHLO|nr:hypothetical protein MNEG_14650 [Monoraphidium neglectum]KIY93312.1 hypothetical protein MNEG_14650 [Monoraphidium neglectum]|eukprot:XP_013892332.1 hypothetical protein MNEG_14650 [Monoraphidium neglectum]
MKDYLAAGARGSDAVWDAARSVEPGGDSAAVGRVGYNQAFEQVFQAFEQRLPVEGVRELCARGAVEPGKYPYDCPGDTLLDVSWHETANDVGGAWGRFLMRPDLRTVVESVRWAVDASGIIDLRRLRDEIIFATLPPLPNIYFAWNPNNSGPLYFLVCLTLGVVVPALR